MKRAILLTLTIILAGLLGMAMQTSSANNNIKKSQSNGKFRQVKKSIPGQYIVVLDSNNGSSGQDLLQIDTPQLAEQITYKAGGSLINVYSSAFKGFSAKLTEEQAIELSKDPNVKFVEEDGIIEVSPNKPSDARRSKDNGNMAITQSGVGWGLDRIDQRDLPLNQTYDYDTTGAGVNAYIIDSGIDFTHTDFNGRASLGFDNVNDGRNGADCHDFGTAVASIVGGQQYGVAKSVNLISVRVLDCNGNSSISKLIEGIDWVTSHHVKPAVATINFARGASLALDTAVEQSIGAGVIYVVSSGSSAVSANSSSPSRVSAALTIGSTRSNDTLASSTGLGSVIDLFAPGDNITSALRNNGNSVNTFAEFNDVGVPFVAGTVARYLENNKLATMGEVQTVIVNNSSTNKIILSASPNGSPNRLLYASTLTTPSNQIYVSQSSFSYGAITQNVTRQLNFSKPGNNNTGNWTVSSNASWLTVSPTSGSFNSSSPSTTTFTINVAGLAHGTYNGAITITSAGASTVTVPVSFKIQRLSVSSINILLTRSGTNTHYLPKYELNVPNVAASTSTNWMKVLTYLNESVEITVAPNGLEYGNYTGTVTLTAPDTINSPYNVQVNLMVAPATTLGVGQVLIPGEYVKSPNGQYKLTMQTDGNLVLYNSVNSAVWASNTSGQTVSKCLLQQNGNLVIYNTSNQAIWETKSGFISNTLFYYPTLAVENEGRVVVNNFLYGDPTEILGTFWASDTLFTGRSLLPGQELGAVGPYRLEMQTDGNLALRNPANQIIWATNTYGNPGSRIEMQTDGNLVIRNSSNQIIWASNTYTTSTASNNGSILKVQADGNVVICRPNGTAIWNRTQGRLY